ncbi:MAG: HD domain-containing protein [Dehalococcoidia bacterium]|nr:HD domain-containing protein [Dehalococcoidia bacterium]
MQSKTLKILVIEDNEADAQLIQEMMGEYAPGLLEFDTVETLAEGMQKLSSNGFAAVLLDLGLPDSKGLDTLTKVLAKFPSMSVIVLTGLADDRVGIEAVKRGAQDYLTKGQINWQSVYTSIHYAIERKEMETRLRENLELQRRIVKGIVEALIRLTGLRDHPNAEHQRRVSRLAVSIAEEMGYPPDRVEFVRTAAELHDIGKAAVPSETLSKPGKLSELEIQLEQSHVQASHNVIKDIEFPWPVAEVIKQHHERLDGSGYPHHLSGDRILPEARILMVADVMDGMCTYRPWRPATPGLDVACKELTDGRGTLYDRDVVDACLKLFKEKGFSFE